MVAALWVGARVEEAQAGVLADEGATLVAVSDLGPVGRAAMMEAAGWAAETAAAMAEVEAEAEAG